MSTVKKDSLLDDKVVAILKEQGSLLDDVSDVASITSNTTATSAYPIFTPGPSSQRTSVAGSRASLSRSHHTAFRDSQSYTGSQPDAHFDATPWPEHTYIIVEKDTDNAITLTNGGLTLQPLSEDPHARNRWHCVNENNFFGFRNTATGRFMGHRGNSNPRMVAVARVCKTWEYLVPRRHPGGGYQLLSPHEDKQMLVVGAVGEGQLLKRDRYLGTVWQFIQV